MLTQTNSNKKKENGKNPVFSYLLAILKGDSGGRGLRMVSILCKPSMFISQACCSFILMQQILRFSFLPPPPDGKKYFSILLSACGGGKMIWSVSEVMRASWSSIHLVSLISCPIYEFLFPWSFPLRDGVLNANKVAWFPFQVMPCMHWRFHWKLISSQIGTQIKWTLALGPMFSVTLIVMFSMCKILFTFAFAFPSKYAWCRCCQQITFLACERLYSFLAYILVLFVWSMFICVIFGRTLSSMGFTGTLSPKVGTIKSLLSL